VAYLKALGDAGERPLDRPLSSDEVGALVGTYRFGPGTRDAFEIAPSKGAQLSVKRLAGAPRNLFHLGDRVFHPAGAEAVRLRFSAESPALTLTLLEPAQGTTATRASAAGS
jgi:hypothetical protein